MHVEFRLVILIALILSAAAVLTACGQSSGSEETADADMKDYGDVFRNIAMKDIEGKKFTSGYFKKNDVTLVTVWGTYCGYCIEEMPDIERIYEHYRDKKAGVIGVVIDLNDSSGSEDASQVEEAVKITEEQGVEYQNINVPESAYDMFADIGSVPAAFLVDRNGKVISDIYMGMRAYDEWSSIIDEKLGN